jgi:cytochrome c oxidase assembly protein subunit 15
MDARAAATGVAHERETDHSYLLATGFGTTVAMWGVGYLCRIPPAIVPSWLLLLFLVACMFGGGFLAGRIPGAGWRAGFWTGIISAGLNLLVLGSLLTGDQPNRVVPSALWYIPGSFVLAAALGAIGAAVGSGTRHGEAGGAEERNWTGVFAKVAGGATLLLLIVGGFVTSERAGLSVVDWPNSYGYGMFLYPISRMTGGIYYEHAHRLFGSLVGLTTLVLAIRIWRVEKGRPWLRRFVLAALVVVIVQGLLGGLRVTGRFTMSESPTDTAPSIGLAVVHGVLAQIFFAMIVSIGAFTTTTWKSDPKRSVVRTAATDRALSLLLVIVVIVQILLGALQRHLANGLMIHITMAMLVLLVAIAAGARAWGLYKDQPIVKRLGKAVVHVVAFQVLLGIGAVIARSMLEANGSPTPISVVIRTAHQATGAILLAYSVLLMLWTRKLLAQEARVAR